LERAGEALGVSIAGERALHDPTSEGISDRFRSFGGTPQSSFRKAGNTFQVPVA